MGPVKEASSDRKIYFQSLAFSRFDYKNNALHFQDISSKFMSQNIQILFIITISFGRLGKVELCRLVVKWLERPPRIQKTWVCGDGGATRPLPRDGGVEEIHGDPKVGLRHKVWTSGQKWKE